jgi:hydroxymethylpyrimidine pyrophosphatase-like HAD family hydrolase
VSTTLSPATEHGLTGTPTPQAQGRSEGLLEAELHFYQYYSWCLNPYPTVGEAIQHLSCELDNLGKVPEGWQTAEVMTNVYLLSCAVLNSVDEYLRGSSFRLPRKVPALPLARLLLGSAEKLTGLLRWRRRAMVRRWRAGWHDAFDRFLTLFVAAARPDPAGYAEAGHRLAPLLRVPLPRALLAETIYIPSAFRKHDLTHHDVLALGRQLVGRYGDRQEPLLVIGLRTAGSYFAPLLRAFLKDAGYTSVDSVTVRPGRGLGAEEQAAISRCARAGCRAVILDDSPGTGDSIALAVDLVRKAGFASNRLSVLVPVHPAARDWLRHPRALSLADTVVLTLEPEDRHKQRLLDPNVAEGRIAEYYLGRGFTSACLMPSAAADNLTGCLESASDDPRRSRLKRIYEVRLQAPDGRVEVRYVVAKSVGWGWLGYHAFLAGRRLAGHVPPVLGLRDGILYSEWLPQPPAVARPADREVWIDTAAAYVAARVRTLGLESNPMPGLGLHQHHDGYGLLDKVLSRAYGGALAAGLKRPRVRHRLSTQPCPRPTLIDGKMAPSEWIAGPAGPLKSDYEHHGLGKNELNVLDPAFDLAELILHLALTPDEERRLLERYMEQSGDAGVGQRLFLNKVLAGSWAMASALKNLFNQPARTERQHDSHRSFVRAWNFLTSQAARECGSHCRRPQPPLWCSPLVVLDIDGVLDRRVFGFPCTTAAGVEALALLHAHDCAVAVDTARSVAEVKEYCRAYGLVGGVAEYGSYVWDAVAGRGRALVSAESLRQLERARQALARLPGVFVNDGYRFSIRACTYEDRSPPERRGLMPYAVSSIRDYSLADKGPAPLPTLLVQHVMSAEGLDRLSCHQTGSDTTIVSREVDKGTGLLALLSFVGQLDAETVAVGDSEADLPMFRAARRSFAPAQIACARQARALGCKIDRRPFQRGLLGIVRSLVHPGGGRCRRCSACAGALPRGQDLILDLLRDADQSRSAVLLRAFLDPKTYQVFVR